MRLSLYVANSNDIKRYTHKVYFLCIKDIYKYVQINLPLTSVVEFSMNIPC